MPRRAGRGKRGFTLLEALVALAVVGFLLVPILQVFVNSRATSRAASRELAARLVFDRLLARLPVAQGTTVDRLTGSDGGFDWVITATPELVRVGAASSSGTASTFGPYLVHITLNDGVRSTSIDTVRLGPGAAPGAGGDQ